MANARALHVAGMRHEAAEREARIDAVVRRLEHEAEELRIHIAEAERRARVDDLLRRLQHETEELRHDMACAAAQEDQPRAAYTQDDRTRRTRPRARCL